MSAVPTVPPVVSGVYPSSSISALVAVESFLLKRPMARLRQIVVQSLTNAAFTPITFTTSDVDQDYLTSSNAGHSNSVNTSRYTANFAGWYQVSGGVSYAVNAAGVRAAYWYVNGSPANGVESMGASAAAVNFGTVARTELLYLNVGDYVELYGYQTSGGALNTVASNIAASTANIKWESN